MGNCVCRQPDRTYSDTSKSLNKNNPSVLGELDQKHETLGYEGQICLAKIISVYDGDTCTANIACKYGVFAEKIRLDGYDSPEIKPKHADIPDENKRKLHILHGKTCKSILEKLVLNRYVLIKCGKRDKYGRLLGTLYVPYTPAPFPVTRFCTLGDVKKLERIVESSKLIPDSKEKMIEGSSIEVGSDPDLYINLNQWMIKNTTSLGYDGGKKAEFVFSVSPSPVYNQLFEDIVNNKDDFR